MNEHEFQVTVLALARLCGWRHYHTHDSRHSPAGFPDLVLVRPPHLLLVELKSTRGTLTDEQFEWLGDLRACGVDARVWRPTDWAEIEAVLGRRQERARV